MAGTGDHPKCLSGTSSLMAVRIVSYARISLLTLGSFAKLRAGDAAHDGAEFPTRSAFIGW